ncbi:MAG: hypothetical protein EBT02_12625, partial [Planctomycetia bacterium]|nr:hypothetical protein [Planctomycetia bacterium]
GAQLNPQAGQEFEDAIQAAKARDAAAPAGGQRVGQTAARNAELQRLAQDREARGRSRSQTAVQTEEQPETSMAAQTIERPVRVRAQPIQRTEEEIDETLRQIESMLRRKDSVQRISRTLGIKSDLLNRVIAEAGWSGLLPKPAKPRLRGIDRYRRSYNQDESHYGSLLKSVYNSL